MEQKVLTKGNQPPPMAVDVERVKAFEEDHTGAPVLGSVQMDWPIPFTSQWNAAAIHVLAQGFWDAHKDAAIKQTDVTFEDIKALCICKLERTRREYIVTQNADRMDTGDEEQSSSAKTANRRYTRRLGVSS
jgi:hypothetical protein